MPDDTTPSTDQAPTNIGGDLFQTLAMQQQQEIPRTMALKVKEKHLDREKPEASYFDVEDERQKPWRLITRNASRPLTEVKIKVGGTVIAEGTFTDENSEVPTLNSRYVTAGVMEAGHGFVMPTVARLAARNANGETRIDLQALSRPQRVTDPDELNGAIVAAIEENRGTRGWPGAILNIRQPTTGRTHTEVFYPATEGEVGNKQVASAEAQHDRLESARNKPKLDTIRKHMQASGAELEIDVVPLQHFPLGRDTGANAARDPAFGGNNVFTNDNGEQFKGENPITRRLPKRAVTDASGQSRTEFDFCPCIVSLTFPKDASDEPDTSRRPFVTKMTPLVAPDRVPTVAINDMSTLNAAIDMLADAPPLSPSTEETHIEHAEDDFDLDQLAADMAASRGTVDESPDNEEGANEDHGLG